MFGLKRDPKLMVFFSLVFFYHNIFLTLIESNFDSLMDEYESTLLGSTKPKAYESLEIINPNELLQKSINFLEQ